MIAPETVCFYYSKDKVKSKKEAAIYRERRKGRDGWKSPPEHLKDKTGLDASAKLTRAKLNKRFGDDDLLKDNSGPESLLEFRRSWYVEGHIKSGVISSVLMSHNQRTIRQRYNPCEGPLSLKGHLGDEGLCSGGIKLNSIFITAEVEFFEGWKPLLPLQLDVEEVMLE
ncbi:hypothetical protein Tco_0025694 [Tanacetum coccineum]